MQKVIRICDRCGESTDNPKGWLYISTSDFTDTILIRQTLPFFDSPGIHWIDCCGEHCLHKILSSLLVQRLASAKEVA